MLPPSSTVQVRLDADQLLYAAARRRFCDELGRLSLTLPPACRRPCSVFMAGGADEHGEARALLQHWGLLGQGQQAWLTSLLVSDPPAGEGGARTEGNNRIHSTSVNTTST